MSEAYYRKLQLPEVQLLHNVSVWSATGSNLAPLGLVKCAFLLGNTPFEYSFICARAQLISQHVDAGQLNVSPQQQPITLSLTKVMLN